MLEFNLQRFAGEKTERATPKRRQEARRKGQMAKSPELTSAITLIAVLVALKAFGPTIWTHWYNMMAGDLGGIDVQHSITQEQVFHLFYRDVGVIVSLLAPVLAVGVITGLLMNFIQVRFVFLPNLLIPDFSRISPVAGFQRLFSVRSLVETLKSMAKLSVIGILIYSTFLSVLPDLQSLLNADLSMVPGYVGHVVFQLAIKIAVLMLVLAILDFMFQRFQFEKGLKMSKDEVKDEHKQQEGDPKVKGKIRQKGRSLVMQRMMKDVPKADVVVTNPTHFAIALKYDSATMQAPTVLAKGQDETARRIRELAEEANVPLVENKPLAQTLFRTVEVGDAVPGELYKAVAEVLAYVYRLRQRTTRG
ncbi:flagellar biosynthesis protein FlhB [Alicyclobacillus tolerans]|uniref:flagellar biosynthesis protein FlhB n=1 Tax=Alicyclobacillus tolerans TaxID=90970 RepID=UPI001F0285B4|nr:flagellar biosynthesis protein FlhB [Alicyclobacillus tolerans]MCF8564770.1 flagellar biosynthesis protein FlhB [Alicyclobacillus tolerans]